jgi:glycosyltransferase involved in cell wall biosynthesis
MLFSIITVVLNNSNYIEQTIKNIIEQKYNNIEYIIIDGGSTDGTFQIIKSLELTIKNEKQNFIFISEPDKGIYDAMNKGIKIAKGEIIGMLNSGDQFYNKEVLELINKTFQNNDIDCCFGNLVYFDKTNKIIRKWNSKPFQCGLFAKSWTPAHPTFYCKRELFYYYGFYKTDYKIAADVELMLRFLEVHKVRSLFLDEYFVKMRSGGVSNKGLNSTIVITQEMKRAFQENGLQFNLVKYLFYKAFKLKEFIL